MPIDTLLEREIRRMGVLHARELAHARRRSTEARTRATRLVVLRGGRRTERSR